LKHEPLSNSEDELAFDEDIGIESEEEDEKPSSPGILRRSGRKTAAKALQGLALLKAVGMRMTEAVGTRFPQFFGKYQVVYRVSRML
jgi:hypothetical protein